MKTERRHELQTNQLADWLGHQVEQIRPHFNIILGLAVLGAAAIIGYFVYARDRQSSLQVAWGDFYLAMAARDRDALENVAKRHAGTVVELCAKQAQADLDLSGGIAALYINREEAYRALNDAKKSYTEVLNGSGSQPEMTQHSLFGLGQVSEATSNLDKAKDYYLKVTERFPDSPMAIEAHARLRDLENPQIEKWYNWFARQKPKPAGPPGGLPNLPGMPDDLTKLPEKPDFPTSPIVPPSTTTPETTTPKTTAPVTTGNAGKDGGPEKKPDEKKPESAKPESAKPESAKPETAKPEEKKGDKASAVPPAAGKDSATAPGT